MAQKSSWQMTRVGGVTVLNAAIVISKKQHFCYKIMIENMQFAYFVLSAQGRSQLCYETTDNYKEVKRK